MNNYWFDIRHYWKTTDHLSNMQDLAYRRLLDLYYGTGEPISRDLTWVAEQIDIVPAVIEPVLNEFFVLKDDGWHRSPEDQARERGTV